MTAAGRGTPVRWDTWEGGAMDIGRIHESYRSQLAAAFGHLEGMVREGRITPTQFMNAQLRVYERYSEMDRADVPDREVESSASATGAEAEAEDTAIAPTTIDPVPTRGDVLEAIRFGTWSGRVLRTRREVAWAAAMVKRPGHRLLRGGLVVAGEGVN